MFAAIRRASVKLRSRDKAYPTTTKRPHVRGPLFFLCFSRGRRVQPNLTRIPLLYVPFDFFLAFFFMTIFLALALSPNRNNGNRQMNMV
jgi:hypothetical protein